MFRFGGCATPPSDPVACTLASLCCLCRLCGTCWLRRLCSCCRRVAVPLPVKVSALLHSQAFAPLRLSQTLGPPACVACVACAAVAASLRRHAFLVSGLRVVAPLPTTSTPPHRHRIISAQEHEEPRPDTPPQRGTRPRKVRMPLRRTTPPESPLVSGPEAAEYRTRGVPNRRGSPSPLRDHTG